MTGFTPTLVGSPSVVSGRRVAHLGAWHVAWLSGVIGLALGFLLVVLQFEIVGGAVAVLGLAPLFVTLDRQTTPGLFPGCCTLGYLQHALGYAIGPLGYLAIDGRVTGKEQGAFALAQWGGVLALLVFAVCYYPVFRLVSGKKADRSKHQLQSRSEYQIRHFWMLLLPVSALIVVYGFASGVNNRLSPASSPSAISSTLFGSFSLIPQAMFFFLGYAAAKSSRTFAIWVSLFATYSIANFLDGTRGASAWALLYSISGMYLGGVKVRRLLVPLCLYTAAFVPLANVLVSYRGAYVGTNSLSDRWAGITTSFREFQTNWSHGDEKGVEKFLYGVTAHVVDRIFLLVPDSVPFAGFAGMENIGYSLIPRVVAPNRPDPDDPNGLAIQYGAANAGTTGSYVPAVGDGYRRFGWPGIVLLYAWLAAVWATWMGWSWRRKQRLHALSMAFILVIMAPGIWSTTLPMSFYLLLWIFPKYLAFFWVANKLHGYLWESYTSHVGRTAARRWGPRSGAVPGSVAAAGVSPSPALPMIPDS